MSASPYGSIRSRYDAAELLDITKKAGGDRASHPSASVGTPAEQHDDERFADDPKIPTQRPVLDVIKVKLDHAFAIHFTPPADLPGTGQPGHRLQAACISGSDPRPKADRCREVEGDAGRPSSSHRGVR